MSKAVRYPDGTLMMPGSEALRLHEEGQHEDLAAHMKQLDATWCKSEGRKPSGYHYNPTGSNRKNPSRK